MTTTPPDGSPFRYEGFEIDPPAGRVRLNYAHGARRFEERFTFDPTGDWAAPGLEFAIRWLFLLAGVSYYKTAPTRAIELGEITATLEECNFLTTFYREGLGEFAYRNSLDLSEVVFVGPESPANPRRTTPAVSRGPRRPLVPFGGGIDSIVTVETVRKIVDDVALFVVSPAGARFEAIEGPAAVSGLPIVRVDREIDPILRQGATLGFLNGHVPVTGILSAAAVVAACLGGRDGVVMSNERSASVGTVHPGSSHAVNHQWSKSVDFEREFRNVLAAPNGPRVDYFSLLRSCSELWVATRFAALGEYHPTFRSCNRAFHLDPAARLDHWCGECDKCCFIDLVLAPFLPRESLGAVFGGDEPLDRVDRADTFRGLLDVGGIRKPFECVGDVDECRAALRATSERRSAAPGPLLEKLVDAVTDTSRPIPSFEDLLVPSGEHYLSGDYAAALG